MICIFCALITWKHFSRPVPGPRAAYNRSSVRVAVVMPHSFFNGKEYQKKMFSAANRYSRLEFTVHAQHYKLNKILLEYSSVNSSSSLLLRCYLPCQVQLRWGKHKVLKNDSRFQLTVECVRCWVRSVTSSSVKTSPLWSTSPIARSTGGEQYYLQIFMTII